MKKPYRIRAAALGLALVLGVGCLLTVSPMPTRADTVSQLQDKLDRLEREEKALKNELAASKNDVKKQQEYADSLKEKMQNSREQIAVIEQQILLLNEEIGEKAASVQEKEAEITKKEEAVDAQLALFGERLRAISHTGNVSALQMLFDMDNYVDFLLRESVVARIAESDQRQIDKLTADIEALNGEKALLDAEKAKLEEERAAVKALKASADEKKKELDLLYAECNAVLKKLQNTVDKVKENLEDIAREEAAVDAEIKKLLAATESTDDYAGGTMFWPVPTVRAISSPFGPREGGAHRGIDIANGPIPVYGENIVAAADGTVVYANKSGYGGGYGLYVMVDHGLDDRGRQIVTLYAHMSAVHVSVGDKVTGGKTPIGQAGDTGRVDGPHLHFEVRVNGTAVDPLTNGYLKL